MALPVALCMLALGPSAGAAEVKLPVGQADGVLVERRSGALVVVFTPRAAKLYRRVAGKRVIVLCTKLPPVSAPGYSSKGLVTRGVTKRAAKRRRAIRTGNRTRGLDYCRVWLAAQTVVRKGKRERRQRELIASVPLSQAGAVRLDEESRGRTMFILLSVAGFAAEKRTPNAYPNLTRLLPAKSRSLLRVVALKDPAGTPPAGWTGYYTDGLQHVVVVAVSTLGRRMFYEQQGRDEVRTNLTGLFSDFR